MTRLGRGKAATAALSLLLLASRLFVVEGAFYRQFSRVKTDKKNDGILSSARRSLALNASRSSKFKNFEEMLDAYASEPVLIYFTSMMCGPCKLQKQELSAARKMMDRELKILAIDTEKWPHVGSRFEVAKLPCLLVMKDKQVLMRLDGLTKAEDLLKQVHSTVLYTEIDA